MGWVCVLVLGWLGEAAGMGRVRAIEFADSALEQAVRRTLDKLEGALTQDDMDRVLDLGTNAVGRGITSLAGLESARYLTRLNLGSNRLTSVTIPAAWELLVELDLSRNELDRLEWGAPPPLLQYLDVSGNRLERLDLPEGLISLEGVRADSNRLTRLDLPAGLGLLNSVVVPHNRLTNFVVPGSLQLASLHLRDNPLARLEVEAEQMRLWWLDAGGCPWVDMAFLDAMPRLKDLNLSDVPGGLERFPELWAQLAGLGALQKLNLAGNGLGRVDFVGLSRALQELDLRRNGLETMRLPGGLTKLTTLALGWNRWRNMGFLAEVESEYVSVSLEGTTSDRFELPPGADRVVSLWLGGASVRSLTVPPGWRALTYLDVSESQITNLTLASDLGALRQLDARGSRLQRLLVPGTLGALQGVLLDRTPLEELRLGRGLTNMFQIGISDTHVRSLVLPPGMRSLNQVPLDGVTLETLLVSTDLVENLGGFLWLAEFKGVRVRQYPPVAHLTKPRWGTGGVGLDVDAPPGRYRVLRSKDLGDWVEVGVMENEGVGFTWQEAVEGGAGAGFFRVQEVEPWFP